MTLCRFDAIIIDDMIEYNSKEVEIFYIQKPIGGYHG
jgi:hypothetical protein